jgi:Holliday junction resolvasome RuvABC DNA-binding subunit
MDGNTHPSNADLAAMLERVADLLEFQGANPFRVRSYRYAASTIRESRRSIESICRESGEEGLRELPGIGVRLAAALHEVIETGHLRLLERLESEVSPEEVFCQLPGVGSTLARRIHEELGVHTLEGIEVAAQNGRLEAVEGIGRRKAAGIADALAGILSRSARRHARRRAVDLRHEPPVELLLDLDAEYRREAAADRLRRIAPRRFNPEHRAWLPIMEVTREGWEFTLLFSNTARAHELERTDDWVVIYYHRDHDEGQCTLVTAQAGPLRGLRVVRGREPECVAHYGARPSGKAIGSRNE